MAVSVYLDFVPPNHIPNMTSLHIFESAAKTGPFQEIEEVTAVGTQGSYITSYTTDKATSASDWFAIQWEDGKGALTDMSSPVKGGTQTVVGEVVTRVMQRDPFANEEVVTQEAEAIICKYFGVTDPYDPALVATYQELNGLTYLTLAFTYLSTSVTQGAGAVESATVGLVTLRSGTSTATKTVDIGQLLELAANYLGVGGSRVMQIEEILHVYGGPAWSDQFLVGEIHQP